MNIGDETRVSGMPDPPAHRPETGRDNTVINRPVVGRPQILAPQANDPLLPAPAVHEVKRRKTGPILVLFALIAVAVVAALAAAYSQFGRDPDIAATTPTTDSVASTTSVPATTTAPVTTVDPNALQVVLTEDPFICDGESRQLGLISKADPNEEIAFSSPQAGNISPGQAADDGTLPIRWQCTADQVGTVWNLTAAGSTSGKVAFFEVVGAAPGTSGNADGTSTPITVSPEESTTSTVQKVGGELTAVVTEDPFVCNGQAREFGKLSGAEPNEEIGFTSPQATGISSGNADANGERAIRWSCTPDQAGTTWELTATGKTSGRTVTVSFTGA